MELLRVNELKLKITLTPEDMERFELQCDSMDYANAETKRAFREILEETGLQSEFDSAHARIMVQVFPSKDGGCEMFITRLPEEDGSEPQSVPRLPTAKYCVFDYKFTEQTTLLQACYALNAHGYRGESAVFLDERETYHLLLRGNDVPFLTEFCDTRTACYDFSAYKRHVFLLEHDAIPVLAALK